MSHSFKTHGYGADILGAAGLGAYPVTIACWTKLSAWPTAILTYPFSFCTSDPNGGSPSATNSFYVDTEETANQWRARISDGATTVHSSSADYLAADLWTPIVAIYRTSTSRSIYVNSPSTFSTATTTSAAVVTDLRYMTIGTAATRAGNFGSTVTTALIAEVALWTADLSDGDGSDLTSIMGGGSTTQTGPAATSVRPASLKCYYPLSVDSDTQTDQSGAGAGNLTTFEGTRTWLLDHPTIDYGSSLILMGQAVF